MAAQGNVTWDALCETWDDCTSQRVWNCFAEIIQQGGGMEEYDWIQRYSLNNKDRNVIVSLYVEVFKDHLTSEEKSLLEAAGIKLTYIDKAEVNEAIQVVLKSKKVITETKAVEFSDEPLSTKEQIAEAKTIGLKELMKILKIK
jgi:hypothetical protein